MIVVFKMPALIIENSILNFFGFQCSSLKGWGIIASFGRGGIVNRSPSYSSRLLLCYVNKDEKLYFWRVKMTDFLSVDPTVASDIHLCLAGCHARYVRNTLLCTPSTTSLLVTIIGASIYHNYIFSCFFVFFAFTSSCFLLLRQKRRPYYSSKRQQISSVSYVQEASV